MNTNSAMTFEAGVMIGDFRIEARIGAGGMGVVYRARQVSLNRVVALKVLGGALRSSSGMARFQREAQAIAKLNHPGIAGIHFIGQDEQICYMAMEYVEGVSLREVLHRVHSASAVAASLDDAVWRTQTQAGAASVVRFDLPSRDQVPAELPPSEPESLSAVARELATNKAYVRRCVELVRDIALALAYAHEQGVIHRDVKPENLLLDQAGKVTVIDFGLARFYEDQTITHSGQLVGTPLYMSPEQVLGRAEVDGRTDIYSLGMVLHELLTLEPPLSAPNRESLFRQIVMQPLPPINWINPAVPEGLASIVHRALAKNPDERYATMDTFAADLERFLAGKEVTAPHYRYRFDESEITAQRPGAVMFLFVCCAAPALLMTIFLGSSIFAMLWDGRLSEDIYRFIPVYGILVAIAAPLFVLSRGILHGRSLGWWGGLTLGAFYLVLVALSPLVSGDFRSILLTYSWLLVSFGVAFFGVLLHPRIRRWFRFAAETRAAFRRQKQNSAMTRV